MPQPALHLLIADRALHHWRTLPAAAPFDIDNDVCANAFRHGCLAPDYGLFPGGDAGFSGIAHHGSTGALLRAVLNGAHSEPQRAFAWGWLTHILADAAIHPIVNDAAARFAAPGRLSLADHVRVEVGLDVWLCWEHEALRTLRLTPAFTRDDYTFVAGAFGRTHGYHTPLAQLVRMQRGMIHFTHAALHFATSIGRDVCWDGDGASAARHPASVLLWRVASTTFSRTSLVHAWLNPLQPAPSLIENVQLELDRLMPAVDTHVSSGLKDLPDYDLETGEILTARVRGAA